MIDSNMEIFSNYLEEINELDNWSELKLQVEIQPGILGFKGWARSDDNKTKSLKTKPTEELKMFIKYLHSNIATSYESKWNKLEFILYRNMTYKRMFIWDSEWQQIIDAENRKHKQNNPDYELPKWQWEKDTNPII